MLRSQDCIIIRLVASSASASVDDAPADADHAGDVDVTSDVNTSVYCSYCIAGVPRIMVQIKCIT